MKSEQKGFTLIELLIVIAIIGLLASIVLASLTRSRAKARDAKRLSDVRQMMTGLELYYNTVNGYPASSPTPQAITPGITLGFGLLAPNYIAGFNAAPSPVDGTCTVAQNTYYYSSTGGTTYTLTFCLGAQTGSYAAGFHTGSQSGIQ